MSLAVSVSGQKPSQNRRVGEDKNRRQERPAEIENLISDARLLPAEFAADALVRIAQSTKVTNREWKREILEEAFQLTAEVQQPVRRKVVPFPRVPVDTRSGYFSYAFDLKLDALSLRSRIINSMLEIDKPRARDLLTELPQKPSLHALTCEDTLVYDVSDFYDMLSHLALTTFSAEAVQQGERLQFLLPYVETISSPSQIVPVAKLLLSMKASPAELMILRQSFSSALKRISGDDRSFSYAITREQTIKTIYDMARASAQQDVQHNELLESFRFYLVKNLNATRCMDNAIGDVQQLPPYIRDSSFLFADKPLTIDEIKQSKTEPTGKITLYWESRTAKRLLTNFKELRFNSETEERSTEAEKETQGWQEMLTDFLSDLERWNGTEENSELDYLHQKDNLFEALIETVPKGPARDQVLRTYVSDLAQQSMLKESRIEWFLHVNHLLSLARTSGDVERSRILEVLSSSKNPTLRLYADLVRLQL